MEKRDNYELMKHQMQEQFASYDMDAMCQDWDLPAEDLIPVTLLSRQYFIDRTTGAVLFKDGDRLTEAGYYVCMTLFDILTRPRQRASGEMISLSSLSTMHTLDGNGFFSGASKAFEHRCIQLSSACRQLGGIPYGMGDVSYKIPVFRDLFVALRFWDSDDEFPANLSFLCDSSILDFMHFETVMFLLSHLTSSLRELMDASV